MCYAQRATNMGWAFTLSVVLRKISSVFLFVIGTLFFAGCLTVPSASERLFTADAIAKRAGFHRSQVQTTLFLLTAYSKILEPGKDIHVYIEGDGYAWVTRSRISGDPTPHRPVALELAAEDPAPNVVYLSRPCQYTPVKMNPVCKDETYWTDKRFSEEVIASVNQAIDKFVRDARGSGIHLIGYSGGGAVAVLIAARRKDVKSLRSVAGNLDPNSLNQYHEVSALAENSLDPMDVTEKLCFIPQCHFIGTEDEVVPALIAENFSKKAGCDTCIHVERVKGADHVNGWAEAWPRLLKLSLNCSDSNR